MTLADLKKVFETACLALDDRNPDATPDEFEEVGLRAVVNSLCPVIVRAHQEGQEFGFSDGRTAVFGAEVYATKAINDILGEKP